jgi:hypothetical protein
MSDRKLVSIIVNNYNYGRFVGEAIESALAQTYDPVEVIVVDDGSSDDSRDRISPFGDRIRTLFKANGGQASSFNAGFAASRGDIVLFLDADDVLVPTAVEWAVPRFADASVAKVHWPLRVIDQHGVPTGEIEPDAALPGGDLATTVLTQGPEASVSSPTSGNAWSRRFLDRVLPMPAAEYRICADAYLFCLAPIVGRVAAICEPLSLYRRHGQNSYAKLAPIAKLRRDRANLDLQCAALERFCRETGIAVETERWRREAWVHRLLVTLDEIATLVPTGECFILVDDGEWGQDYVEGRRVLPFLERDGVYWGAPADDETAIRELERLCALGPTHIVVGWPAFWWLEYYAAWHRHLRRTFRCVVENDRLIVFDARERLGR